MPQLVELRPQFTDDEIKLLLVAVRQMRRTFVAARKQRTKVSGEAPPLDTYEALYDQLYEKLRSLAGPIPEVVEDALE
ncbi:MAG TPA: hypothetical protein VH640_18270 [Bryobacteraceae bacterium]|jgi:hypothetical protein